MVNQTNMRRSASEIIRNLESRIARLERHEGKTASQVKPTLIFEAWDETGEKVSKAKFVKCELTHDALVGCAKRELGVDCWFDDNGENLFLSRESLTIQIWCGENSEGIYYATFTLKGHAHNVLRVLPVK